MHKMEFPWEQLTEWIGANSFVSIAPIVLAATSWQTEFGS